MSATHIAWFRRDLRLDDNPMWAAASAEAAVVAVAIIEPSLLDTAGPFRRAAYLGALQRLDAALAARGGRLRVETGDPVHLIPRIAIEVNAASVQINADVTRWAQRRDATTRAALDVPLDHHWGTLVHEPGTVLTKAGTLSRVFTPFHKAWARIELDPPATAGGAVVGDNPGTGIPAGERSDDPPPYEILDEFLNRAERYPTDRDRPGVDGTSGLSVALRFGTLSARQAVRTAGTDTTGRAAFVRQLAWRDWYAHMTLENPDIDRVALRPDYDTIAWETGPDADTAFAAWSAGRTGYPIVDAGMRELAATGTMHNRVRMIVASFLVKDLLIDWRRGERWFRHWLADGDIAQNAGNWQWVAGTGPDAAPYFRIFNPTAQSRRFDPDATYIRRWVPELAELPNGSIHAPWEIPPLDLAAAGITLGETYPPPIVDHAAAREETLLAYRSALDTARDK